MSVRIWLAVRTLKQGCYSRGPDGLTNSPKREARMGTAISDLVALKHSGVADWLVPLLSDARDEVSAAAVEVLMRLPLSEEDLSRLCTLLHDGNPHLRLRAMEVLSLHNNFSGQEAMVGALSDSCCQVASHAAEWLAKRGWRPVTDAQRLSFAVSLQAHKEVETFGTAAVPALLHMLHTERIVDSSAWMLTDGRYSYSYSHYRGSLDSEARAFAAYGLGRVREASAVDSLIRVVEQHQKDSRAAHASAWALGVIGDTRAVPSLLRFLASGDFRFKSNEDLLRALGALGDARAVVPLCELLSRSQYPKAAVCDALGALGDARAVVPLCDALSRSKYGNDAVCDALGRIGTATAAIPLLAWLRGPSRPGNPRALAALVIILKGAVRDLSIDELGEIARMPDAATHDVEFDADGHLDGVYRV